MTLHEYVGEFNRQDIEYYPTEIPNAAAEAWLSEEIPKLTCDDKALEKTYYYRWWVYRKHLHHTPEGYMVTEFLPKVPWSGRYNVINAAAGHHIAEGRWLKNGGTYLYDYANLFLTSPEEGQKYSCWLIYALHQLKGRTGEIRIADFPAKAAAYLTDWERVHGTETGLFWSRDGRDAMEFSISGTRNGKPVPGLRPTLNSYMCADYRALYELSAEEGHPREGYLARSEDIRRRMEDILFRDGFYKAIHPENENYAAVRTLPTENVPRELIGFIPWYFDIPAAERDGLFDLLGDPHAFYAREGLTTAEQSDPRFLFPADHECLWNGYVWPFATSQTLTALLRAIRRTPATRERYTELFYKLLRQYAAQHYLEEDGMRRMWIDEVGAPDHHEWTSRTILKNAGWQPGKGGRERGKDYNHSTYADILLSALTGVDVCGEEVTFAPVIPADMRRYTVDDLYIRGARYRVEYDRDGAESGTPGFSVYKEGKLCFHA